MKDGREFQSFAVYWQVNSQTAHESTCLNHTFRTEIGQQHHSGQKGIFREMMPGEYMRQMAFDSSLTDRELEEGSPKTCKHYFMLWQI